MCSRKEFRGLGFQDIHEFNLALLGKQVWRLAINLGSLVSRIFKARYYPNSSVLNATLGDNPIFLWRSLIAAQELVQNGVIW